MRMLDLFRATLVLSAFAATARIEAAVQLPDPAEECIAWAAQDAQAALNERKEDADVAVTVASGAGLPAEGFALAVAGKRVTVTGGDAVGAMYGLLEFAEQVRSRGVAGLTATTQKPFLEFRADNPFCQMSPLLIDDVAMWRSYIDLLARSRFNVIDLHGGYDLNSTGFPNLYPLLVHVADYPQVGNAEEQAKHLANFKTIIAYARSRGVKVAFMNYAANVKEVPKDKLADYTAKAVAQLIKELPDLYLLGFRVGETGQPASFFKDSYLKGVADSTRADLRLYTRSWLTTQEQLEAIGKACKGNFDIEIKYNGEQLGLPYHALQEGFGSYSYQGYLIDPAPYRIIWQIRANGTHRYWAWADTDFVRRTVLTCRLGDARGFTLEPHISYFDVHAPAYYRSDADKAVYAYVWEKHWMWYLTWGRLAYNPELSADTLIAAYARHFGSAGATIYRAMQDSGWIVPLTLAYRFMGPDHRDHSPETETGVVVKGTVSKEAKDQKHKDPVREALAFASAPMDHRSFAGHGDFLDAKLAGRSDGRIGPPAIAARFAAMAAATRADVVQVGELGGHAGDEWRLLKVDLLAASHLADYEAARIDGSLRADYGLRVGDKTEFDRGLARLAESRAAWKALAETTDPVYAPLLNQLRHQKDFQWAKELPALEDADSKIAALWPNEVNPTSVNKPLMLTPAELGEDPGIVLGEVKRTVAADHLDLHLVPSAKAGVAAVVCWWKELPSETKWQQQSMTAGANGDFAATLPLKPVGVMYQFEIRDRAGQARCLPDALKETPYFTLTPKELVGAH